MARPTSSAVLLPAYTIDLVWRYWAPLLCVYTAGMLVHALLMRGLVAFSDVNATLSLAGLGLTLLVTLITFVIMFQLVRPSLRTIDSELSAEPVRRHKKTGFVERERRVVDGVALAILPFLLFYGAWGLIAEEFNVYSIGLLNTEGLAAFAEPTELSWYGMPLAVALVAWVLRRVCGRFYESSRNPALGVLTALFEGVWTFMFLFSLGHLITEAQTWLTGRVAWVTVQESLAASVDGLGAMVDLPDLSDTVAAALASLWDSLKAGIAGPLLWLTIAAVIYRAEVDEHDAYLEVPAGRGDLGRVVDKAIRAGKLFGEAVGKDLHGKYTPCINALRFVLGVGPVFYLSFCLAFVVLDVGFSQLGRAVYVVMGPGSFTGEWWPWLQPVDFVLEAVHMVLRVCLLGAAFEIALREAEHRSSGRRVWRVANHALGREPNR
ncbi:hypothetical protein [Nocardiopsis sp. NRRL B-16309]|uniref:hypothetical protein n=1 Tax=Nocardiopsis sp. NRRL B-16309 TaxID=1519494 RepID=UPI0006AEE946|nr:hypothetical protein [Nocardiopsis sp. NRRL B-16309]KOX13207.1 hypothetical protein ADL05_19830 [Nocardiopsis sp. NRRL B-16309]